MTWVLIGLGCVVAGICLLAVYLTVYPEPAKPPYDPPKRDKHGRFLPRGTNGR